MQLKGNSKDFQTLIFSLIQRKSLDDEKQLQSGPQGLRYVNCGTNPGI